MKKLHLIGLATAAMLAAPAAIFASHWSTVCSSGATIDEADLAEYQVDAGQLFYVSNVTGIIQARYDVTNTSVPGDNTPPYTTFELGYTDSSALGSVTAYLWEVTPCPYSRTLICSVTSGDDGNSCATCTFPNNTFNFSTNIYFIGVLLNRTNSAADIRANTLRIF